MADHTGKIVTVEGDIDPENLGKTITHEHVFMDASNWLNPPESAYEREIASGPVRMENLWYINRNPQCSKDNYLLGSMDEAIEEVAHFYRSGGESIVDVTPKGMGQDVKRLRGVGRETGVQFIQGTGYYVKSGHPPELKKKSVDDITEELVSDINDGIDDTRIRAGLIGEIGLSVDSNAEIHGAEIKVLQAAARAALRTGAPLSIHPPGRTKTAQRNRTYPTSRWAIDILDMVEQEGLPPERVVMCHMDRTVYENLEYQVELASRGPYLEYDVWGSEQYHDPYEDGYPSDWWRKDSVIKLIEEGFSEQLLFSQDVCRKNMRRKYGGAGYAHILDYGIPMLRRDGVTEDQLQKIMVDNPTRLLTFA